MFPIQMIRATNDLEFLSIQKTMFRLNEMEKAELIKNISTLKKDMLTRAQLIKLLEDANLKTTGNMEVLLDRLQVYYSNLKKEE